MEKIIKKISSGLNASQLPGDEAHRKMASYKRPGLKEALENDPNPKKSAVLILLYPKADELHTVLMLRPDYGGVHSAQVSFPGGRIEPHDKDLEDTAIRESEEEVGINPSRIETLGTLSELYIPPSRFLVRPFVAYTPETPKFSPDPKEVAALIESPVRYFLEDHRIKTTRVPASGFNTKIKAAYFDIHGHIVWGATAMIIAEFREVLRNSLNQSELKP